MPFGSRHFSSPFHLKSSRHSKELEKADISRLMDPSYCLPHHHLSNPVTAHVDSKGQMHDPDFRRFPVFSTGRSRRRRSPFASSRSPWDEDVDEADEEDEEDEEMSTQLHNRRQSPRLSLQHDSASTSVDYSYHHVNSYASPSPSSSSLSSDSSSISSFTDKFYRYNPVAKIRSFDFVDWYYQYDSDYTYEQPVAIQINEEYISESDLAEKIRAKQATPFNHGHSMKQRWTKSRFGDAFKRKHSNLSNVTYP
ncbi:hypothetical protein GGU10DRAFT_421933 [Lentinula aff. detonsa]|uniref:Uncharacterized protein n=1 Tax=Lentinula aff. detonsa TaxID=2804958 RepID=A0AA38NM08_9AGAR|nr:hypothetical protein GGU10DRAFT_421933 [Lentinula aff. detonsa]